MPSILSSKLFTDPIFQSLIFTIHHDQYHNNGKILLLQIQLTSNDAGAAKLMVEGVLTFAKAPSTKRIPPNTVNSDSTSFSPVYPASTPPQRKSKGKAKGGNVNKRRGGREEGQEQAL